MNPISASRQSQITNIEDKDGSSKTDANHSSHVWTVPEVEHLLKLYKQREADFKAPTTKKKAIWNDICTEMNNLGFALNPMQCECKLKNMKATYRKILEKADRGIHVAGNFPFYDELYGIFGLAPPLRTYPETTKGKKVLGRKRSVDETEAAVASVESPAEQITHLGLGQLHQQQNGLNENPNKTLLLEVVEELPHQNVERKSYPELVEELLTLRRTLEQERQLREEDRKRREEERRKYEEERDRRAKEFHEERMAMLNSMNKLISNLGSRS